MTTTQTTPAVDGAMPPLTPADLEVLEFERATWRYQGRREAVIRLRFGISTTLYTQRLLRIVEHPDAAAYNPQLVAAIRGRVARRRDQRRHENARLAGDA